ncbi:MAG: hypothetical protein U0835_04985 [Isosphaeraceae bacterium]
MFQADRLAAALRGLGGGETGGLFGELAAAYSAPERFYHNVRHIAECLARFDECRPLAESPAEVELAVWFHDAVYDPRRSDNEEMSAAWAERALRDSGVPPEPVERVSQMILATKRHEAEDQDTQILLDLDLSILGATAERFEEYDRAIRQEYAWVPDAEYRAGRGKILLSFLNRPTIYRTPFVRERCEARARENLARKVAELGG